MPSATEILFELGLENNLKGVTNTCTYPLEALNKPKIITPVFDIDNLDSTEIDKKIKENSFNNKKIFVLNLKKIKEINPDLIISQNLCEVCAPYDREIQEVSSILGYKPKNLNLNPKNVQDILNSIIIIGQEIGNLEKARKIVIDLTLRIETIKQKLNHVNRTHKFKKQKIICLEWISPFYIADHWVPEMIKIIYGTNGLAKKGDSSKIISINEIIEFDPDKIIIMPYGFNIDRIAKEVNILNNDIKWNLLKAVEMNEVYMVDANSYFSKPSPRIVIGIEILSKTLHPDLFKDLKVPDNSYKNITK